MATRREFGPTHPDVVRAKALREEFGTVAAVVTEMGLNRSKVQRLLRVEGAEPPITPPELPDDDIPVEDIVGLMKTRFEKRYEHHKAKKWMPFKVMMDGPIGICWLGDPHVDDDGCNWPKLDEDLDSIVGTEGMFGASIGDATNNWVGRLLAQYARQETSKTTAGKLTKYLMEKVGRDWLIWLIGNHDEWNDGAHYLREMGSHIVVMEDWQAQITLKFPNGRDARIWAAHDFPGHSQWNTMHAAQKAAHMKDWAHLYICGHKHNWALHQEESASKEFIYWLARARGYKFIDDYGGKLGHASQQEGASIVSVFDPDAENMASFLHCYADVQEAAEFLTWKRSKC
jgi:hypothetical protein|tara:strand:- start:1266 stop:2294 length:1029 start_codon:yes stop_codon:yes gene_type:complete